MEVVEEFRRMFEFRRGNPRGLFVGAFVTEPPYEVQELAPPTFVDLRVEDLRHLVLRFAVNLHGRRRRLYASRDGVGDRRLELRDVVDGVNSAH